MRKHFLLIAILLATVVYAAPLPYDETADAKADVKQALNAAKKSQMPVLVIFWKTSAGYKLDLRPPGELPCCLCLLRSVGD